MARILFVVCSVILLTLDVFGLAGRTMASDSLLHLHVDSGRLTGRLTHMTLHEVLGQLHDQLGIDYVVSDAELEKVISVTLQKEPVSMALSKILAQWDYAFTVNTAGKIKTLYVMAKVPPEELVPEAIDQVEALEPYGEDFRELSNAVQADQRSDMSREHPFYQQASLSGLHARESAGRKAERSPGLVPMEIHPPVLGASMAILPANQNTMGDTPGGDNAHNNMEIIPPTAYPPMNIQPVPDHVQQEMLLTLNP
jgi:hypothetical protein